MRSQLASKFEHSSLLDCSTKRLEVKEEDLEQNYEFLKFYVPAVLPQSQGVPNLGEHQATGLQLES